MANVRWHLFADRPDTVLQSPPDTGANVDLFEVRGYRFHTWEQLGLPWRAHRIGVHVLHCTATTLAYWQPVPTLVTVHDILPWHDVELRSYERWYLHRLIPLALEKCAAVITIAPGYYEPLAVA